MSFELPNLKFEYNALEPHIDSKTMEIHLTKHHATYISNLNKALEPYTDLHSKSIEELISNIDQLPEGIQTAVRNNGGGHFNHSFFWNLLTDTQTNPSEEVETELITYFGSVDTFKEKFKKAALARFGSGWAWLVKNGEALEITTTPNQDNPIMEGKTPIIGLDVWEHAYYLNYQNRRADYIDAFWNILDWKVVEQNLI